MNQIRGLVGEYGIVAPWGIGNLRLAIPFWIEDSENTLTCEFRHLLALLYEGHVARLLYSFDIKSIRKLTISST
ncbi:hypothetical protein AB6D90_01865 [Vibrio splendidus]